MEPNQVNEWRFFIDECWNACERDTVTWFKFSIPTFVVCAQLCVMLVCVSEWLLTSPDTAAPLNSSPDITAMLSPLGLSVAVPDQLLHTCRLRPVIFTGQKAPDVIDVSYGNRIRTLRAYAVINCRLDYLWLWHGWLTSQSHQLLTGQCHLSGLDILKQGSRRFVVTTQQMVYFNRSPHRSEVRQYLRLFSPFCLLFFLLPPYF